MSFSSHYFGKPVDKVTFDDIKKLIEAECEESQHIEFKSGIDFEKKKSINLATLGDTISAFLNTGGGLLIIGTPRTKRRKRSDGRSFLQFEEEFQFLDPLPEQNDAERKLFDEIEPIPSGVIVHRIEKENGKGMILAEIQKSLYPPHQYKGTYFLRLDHETKAAPHALVEALFLQRRGPNLECVIVGKDIIPPHNPQWGDTFQVQCNWIIRNNSRNSAHYIEMEIISDTHFLVENGAKSDAFDGIMLQSPEKFDSIIPGVSHSFVYHCKWPLHAFSDVQYYCCFFYQGLPGSPKCFSVDIILRASDMIQKQCSFLVDFEGSDFTNKIFEPYSIESIGAT